MRSVKKLLGATFFLTALVLAVQPVHAAELEPYSTPLRKLQRGFLNIALSPLEIAHALAQDKNKEQFIPTWATGLVRGGVFTVGRALAGVYEMFTFAVPWPPGYEPVMYPEFAWEYFNPGDTGG